MARRTNKDIRQSEERTVRHRAEREAAEAEGTAPYLRPRLSAKERREKRLDRAEEVLDQMEILKSTPKNDTAMSTSQVTLRRDLMPAEKRERAHNRDTINRAKSIIAKAEEKALKDEKFAFQRAEAHRRKSGTKGWARGLADAESD